MKKITCALAVLSLVLFFAGCMAREQDVIGLEKLSVLPAPDGGVYLLLGEPSPDREVFAFGDSVDVVFNRKFTLRDVPYYSGDFAPADAYCLLPAETEEAGSALLLRVPAGTDLWSSAKLTKRRRLRVLLNETGKYLDVERARTFYTTLIGQTDTGGFTPCTYEEKLNMHYVITEFTRNVGQLNADGGINTEGGGSHSQLIPVAEGKNCYMGFRDAEAAVAGAFYTEQGDFLSPLLADAITEYGYRNPNGIAGSWYYEGAERVGNYCYLRLYSFAVPANAAYVSLNLTEKPEYAYRQFLATMPVYALSDTGNLIWRDDEPIYRATCDKRLCIIGQSNIMIDRLLRSTDPGDMCPERYIVGFQEYLIPWFRTVDSFGYSGRGYMSNSDAPGVYDYVIGGGLDISGYDMYLFTPGSNNLSMTNMGAYDSRNPKTYFGAMNALIDYVLAQNGDGAPTICLATLKLKPENEENAAFNARTQALNERIRLLAAARGCVVLDRAAETDPNVVRDQPVTYDGKHANQYGSWLIGMYYREKLVGF